MLSCFLQCKQWWRTTCVPCYWAFFFPWREVWPQLPRHKFLIVNAHEPKEIAMAFTGSSVSHLTNVKYLLHNPVVLVWWETRRTLCLPFASTASYPLKLSQTKVMTSENNLRQLATCLSEASTLVTHIIESGEQQQPPNELHSVPLNVHWIAIECSLNCHWIII